MAWVEEGVMPSVQLIMPPAVGHNIVPGKQVTKWNTVAPAEPVEFVVKGVTRRNTLENATGATQNSVPGNRHSYRDRKCPAGFKYRYLSDVWVKSPG